MRNEFTYDANHRVTAMNNIFFTPLRIEGRYNTTYAYDPAGNIGGISRNGWVTQHPDFGTIYDQIDNLTYDYDHQASRLSQVAILKQYVY